MHIQEIERLHRESLAELHREQRRTFLIAWGLCVGFMLVGFAIATLLR